MGLGKAMQQQQGRPLAADPGEDAAGFGVDPFGGVTGEQVGEIGHVTLHVVPANAGTHNPWRRMLFAAYQRRFSSATTRRMGPGVRRDDKLLQTLFVVAAVALQLYAIPQP